MTMAALVRVYCRNPGCAYVLRRGKPLIVGEITKAARLRCPRCRSIEYYEVA